jgi:RHS repeat-associated protein
MPDPAHNRSSLRSTLLCGSDTKNVAAITRNDTRRAFVAYPLALLVSVIITIGWSGFASADVKYTYTGKPFVHFFPPGACTAGGGECMISGFFTLATPIPANVIGFTVDCRLTGFSFTDGVNTITLADLPKPCGNSLVVVSTDATGQITHWSFTIRDGTLFDSFVTADIDNPGIDFEADSTLGYEASHGDELADNDHDPGTWASSGSIDPSLFDGPRNPAISKHCDSDDFSATNVWAGDPVNALTGNLTELAKDLVVPGRGRSLELDRTYNALDAATATTVGRFGSGWRDSYAMNLVIDKTTGAVTVVQEGGAAVKFTRGGSGSYTAPPYVTATLSAGSGGTYIFTLQNQLTDVFDSTSLLLSETDRNGYTTSFTYKKSTLVSVSDSAGRKLIFTTDANGLVTRVTDPQGRVVNYNYDSRGNLASVTDVAAGLTTFSYDNQHRLLSTTDARGRTVTNVYDSEGRVVSQTDALGRTTTWSYSAVISPSNGNGTTTITDPNGNVTIRQFTNDLLSALTLGANGSAPSTWTYTYDAGFNQTSVTDPNGNLSKMTYDGRANLLSRTDPLSRTSSFTYDSRNDPLTETDPLGVTTTMTYDGHGNLTTASRPLSGTTKVATTTFTYGDSAHPGDVTSITDADGNISALAYDKYGDVAARVDATGDKATFLYNKIGFTTASVSPRGYAKGGSAAQFKTTYTYDAFGDLVQLKDPLAHVAKRVYDANRNLISVTDPNGNTTSYSYDADNERTAAKRADGSMLQTAYDGAGNVISQTDGLGHTMQYAYDAEDRLVTVIDGLHRATAFAYDLNGNRVSRTDPSSRKTTYTYDAANELLSIAYSDGVTPAVSFAYDADGQRVSMSDGTGTTKYTYDSLHRLTNSVNGGGAAVAYHHDLVGRATSITYPNSQSVSRTFDKSGRLTAVADWLSHTTNFTYDADSNLVGESYPNTWNGAFSYDRADGMLGVSYASGTQKLVLKYLRDKIELVKSEAAGTTLSPSFPSRSYEYDALNRLTLDSASSGAYSYDAADRIIGFNGGTLSYDNADELLALGAATFLYDKQGNRIADGTTALGYDQENRLTSFGAHATYAYNGDGLRMSKTVSAVSTAFTWDSRDTAPLLLSDGTNSYIYGPKGTLLEQVGPSNAVLYYHRDQLGSTRMLTGASGAVAATYSFDAYGNPIDTTGSIFNPFLFAGEYTDSESGFEFLRARYYDGSTGQFISLDPIVSATREAYAYADDDPVNLVDPSGMTGSSWSAFWSGVGNFLMSFLPNAATKDSPIPLPLGAPSDAPNCYGAAYRAIRDRAKSRILTEDPQDTNPQLRNLLSQIDAIDAKDTPDGNKAKLLQQLFAQNADLLNRINDFPWRPKH